MSTITSVREPDWADTTLGICQYLIQLLFTLEVAIKLYATGSQYFRFTGNIFDFVILSSSWVLSFYEIDSIFSSSSRSSLTTLVRTFRFVRILFLLRHFHSLSFIVDTFLIALPALGNIAALLGIVLCFYAQIGTNLFSYVKLQSYLSIDANFQSFPTALFTLFRISTGEGWNNLMADLSRGLQPNFVCTTDDFTYQVYSENGITGCGHKWSAFLYFFSFQVIYTLIMLNLLIAVILKVFEIEVIAAHDALLARQDLERFRDIWARFDCDATAFLKVKDFEDFLTALGKPLGWEKDAEDTDKLEFIKNLDLNVYLQKEDGQFEDNIENSRDHEFLKENDGAYYYFHEVAIALSRCIYQKRTLLA